MVEAQTYHAPAERGFATFALVASLAGAAAWVWWRPFRAAVDGASMLPTFASGDWLVATRRGRIRVGTVVVIDHPDRPGFELVKRVAPAPDGRTDAAVGAYWVVGDNPEASTDSRTFGPVPPDAVRGVVRFRYGSSPQGT